MRDAEAAGASPGERFAGEIGTARLTSRPPLTPVRKQPGTAKSHSGRDTARVAGPLARRIEHRKAEKAMAKTVREAKKPKIPAFREENRPRDKKRQIPGNGGQNAPPDEKSPENRNTEKVIRKTPTPPGLC
jgi:hypothetical protein